VLFLYIYIYIYIFFFFLFEVCSYYIDTSIYLLLMMGARDQSVKKICHREIAQLSQNDLHFIGPQCDSLISKVVESAVALAQISMNGSKWDHNNAPLSSLTAPAVPFSHTHVRFYPCQEDMPLPLFTLPANPTHPILSSLSLSLFQ
jgi:hypothetical protein